MSERKKRTCLSLRGKEVIIKARQETNKTIDGLAQEYKKIDHSTVTKILQSQDEIVKELQELPTQKAKKVCRIQQCKLIRKSSLEMIHSNTIFECALFTSLIDIVEATIPNIYTFSLISIFTYITKSL